MCALALCAATMTGLSPAGAAGQAGGSGTTDDLVKIIDLTTSTNGTFGDPEGSPGSVFGASGTATRTKTGDKFGLFGFTCTILPPLPTTPVRQCNTTISTPQGQITLQGLPRSPDEFHEVITGGGGIYTGAQGCAAFTRLAPGDDAPFRVVLTLHEDSPSKRAQPTIVCSRPAPF
ncbi:hypothetical protein ACFQ78_29470 [Streptomyces sp. NPDC056519]|uniref:hypothetical protein n=1 Tax=Streptomyces sp. NPDC056519 TaxID=3345849 RepID=UPI0036AE55A0